MKFNEATEYLNEITDSSIMKNAGVKMNAKIRLKTKKEYKGGTIDVDKKDIGKSGVIIKSHPVQMGGEIEFDIKLDNGKILKNVDSYDIYGSIEK